MRLQSSGVRSCEKAMAKKRASIAISGSVVNQKENKGVPTSKASCGQFIHVIDCGS